MLFGFSLPASYLRGAAGLFTLAAAAAAADLSSSYAWKPVRIGAGGLITGIVIHPADESIRYIRTDVGSAYRWDETLDEHVPITVFDGTTGMPADVSAVPANGGTESVGIDPSNPDIVYVALELNRSSDLAVPDVPGSIYKSTDRGQTFIQSNLSINMDANGPWRGSGERLAVDPNDTNRVFYGSVDSGLYRSLDGGLNWTQLGGSAPGPAANVVGVRCFDSGTTTVTYAMVVDNNTADGTRDGDVLRSTDGGNSWTNLTSSVVVSGRSLTGKVRNSAIDINGRLWVCEADSRRVWRYNGTSWANFDTQLPQNVQNVAPDPFDVNRLWALAQNGGFSFSVNGGVSWVRVANETVFNASFADWLPQPPVPGWHGTTDIKFDRTGRLWVTQGNEGLLTYVPTYTETLANPPAMDIVSTGIEELVTHVAIIPRGGGGRVHVAAHDATGFTITDPDQFNAKWINLQAQASPQQFICNGTGIAACPNDPNYIAVFTTDVNQTSFPAVVKLSGFSTDGGDTWQRFGSQPPGHCGQIAVSRRDPSWAHHHLIALPSPGSPDFLSYGPFWSKDGGQTWNKPSNANGFPVDANGVSTNFQTFIFNFSLKGQPLKADPFVPDKYYLKTVLNGTWVTTNGGESWNQLTPGSGGNPTEPAIFTFHGQLATNENVQNDLWFADGWEGSLKFRGGGTRGLWRSTNGGQSWTRNPAFEHAWSVGLGVGNSGPSSFAVYVYGKLTNDVVWGVFRSTDAGATWDRISRYPTGIFDIPSCVAASWDEFGLVYVGFNGNSFVYGRPADLAAPELVGVVSRRQHGP